MSEGLKVGDRVRVRLPGGYLPYFREADEGTILRPNEGYWGFIVRFDGREKKSDGDGSFVHSEWIERIPSQPEVELKVGDRVRVKPGMGESPWFEGGDEGTVLSRYECGFFVRFEGRPTPSSNGGETYVKSESLELIRPAPEEPAAPQSAEPWTPRKGEKVRVVRVAPSLVILGENKLFDSPCLPSAPSEACGRVDIAVGDVTRAIRVVDHDGEKHVECELVWPSTKHRFVRLDCIEPIAPEDDPSPNPKFHVGDRVRVKDHHPDSHPMARGASGTVRSVYEGGVMLDTDSPAGLYGIQLYVRAAAIEHFDPPAGVGAEGETPASPAAPEVDYAECPLSEVSPGVCWGGGVTPLAERSEATCVAQKPEVAAQAAEEVIPVSESIQAEAAPESARGWEWFKIKRGRLWDMDRESGYKADVPYRVGDVRGKWVRAEGKSGAYIHPFQYVRCDAEGNRLPRLSPRSRAVLRSASRWVGGTLLGSASVYAGTLLFPHVLPVFESAAQTLKGIPVNQFLADPLVFDATRYSLASLLALATLGAASFALRKSITSPIVRWAREARELKSSRLSKQQATLAETLREAVAPLVGTPLQAGVAPSWLARFESVDRALAPGDVIVVKSNSCTWPAQHEARQIRRGDRVVIRGVHGQIVSYTASDGNTYALALSDVEKVA